MSECCGNGCQRGGCDFDLDMIIRVLITIVIVICMCNNYSYINSTFKISVANSGAFFESTAVLRYKNIFLSIIFIF